ncbi:hypothetical protein [uncultured Tateyamaria sp.]|uniref:hypothetical protein n=1 Tax=uncultured Tateyamaria sp. TaxID=455651 RepID=UPI002638D4EA|nr:hypothetical protein [uncultured Tateyamaria sp.]
MTGRCSNSARMIGWLACLFSASSLYGTAVEARNIETQGIIAGENVIVFDDGFWRFADDSGQRCTIIAHVGELCALPSSWARFPQTDPKSLQPKFVRESIEGFVTSLTPVVGPVGNELVNRRVSELADFDGGEPTILQKQTVQLGDFQGQRIVYAHNARVVAFSVFNQNGRILIFQTQRHGFTLFHKDHQAAHEDLINMVTLEDFDG